MSLLVQREGILSTVQDLGRIGFRRAGINPGGAMDQAALRSLNTLLGNADGEAGIEFHFPAGELVFDENCVFAVGGADFAPTLNGRPLSAWTVYGAEKGDALCFTRKISGERAYLAIGGGLAIELWLGSRSTNLMAGVGGLEGRRLNAGDRIDLRDPVSNLAAPVGTMIGRSIVPDYRTGRPLRIIAGPEFGLIAGISLGSLLNRTFRVSRGSNRMGFRLEGPPIHLVDEVEMLSSAVSFGTIQRLPDGQLIILAADHQTTGGYPRIANIVNSDLSRLAQAGPGDDLRFELIEIEETERLDREFEKNFRQFRTALEMKLAGML